MPTLTIGDKSVTVGDEFLKLSPEQQNSTVDEIAKSMGIAPKADVAQSESLVRGVKQGATANFGDELSALGAASPLPRPDYAGAPKGIGAFDVIPGAIRLAGEKLLPGIFGDKGGQAYDKALVEERAANKAAQEANPLTYMGGNIAGGIALPAGAAANSLRGGAAAGALYGGLSGAGDGENLNERLTKGAIGTAVGGVLGGGVGAVVGKLGAPSVANPVIEAADRLGVNVPKAVATDSSALQQAASVARNVPLAGTPLVKASERTIADLGSKADDVAASYGAQSVPNAGSAIREGLEDWSKNIGGARQNALYTKAEQFIDPAIATPLSNTQNIVAQIMAERTAQRVSDPGKAVSFVQDAVSDAQGLTYEGIKGLRTRIGQMMKSPTLNAAEVSQAELKRLYGGLSEDLTTAVQNAGNTTAVHLFKRANDYTKALADRRENLQRLLGAPSEEGVFERLFATASGGSRADSTLLRQARKSLDPDEWESVAGTVVSRLGRDKENQFSPQRFLTDYGKLSTDGKQLLFNSTGKTDLAKSLDDIATVSSKFKDLQKFANPSGTARSGMGGVLGAAAWADPVSTITAVVGGNIASRVMASPATAKSMARWAKAYQIAVEKPAAGSLAALRVASRNFGSTVADKFGVQVKAEDLMKGFRPTSAAQQQIEPNADANR